MLLFNRRVLCLSQWGKKICMFTVVAFFWKNKKRWEEHCGPFPMWKIRLSSEKLEAKMFVRSVRWSCCRNLTSSLMSFLPLILEIFKSEGALLIWSCVSKHKLGYYFQLNSMSEMHCIKNVRLRISFIFTFLTHLIENTSWKTMRPVVKTLQTCYKHFPMQWKAFFSGIDIY